jgi:hydroxypyruvate isomerase
MPRLSVNLDFLFAEVPFLERFERAAAAGFTSVECHWSWRGNVDAVADALRTTRLRLDAMNVWGGNYPGGDRGFASDPGRSAAFREALEEALEAAAKLGGPKLHILAGNRLEDIEVAEQYEAMVEAYVWAAERLADTGRLGLIELLNPVDNPTYILESIDDVNELIDAVESPDLRIQFDVYHLQRTSGEIIPTIRRVKDRIGHVQIADAPGRNQPGTGEINYRNVLAALDEVGYEGRVGLEYRPLGPTEDSFGWIEDYGLSRG